MQPLDPVNAQLAALFREDFVAVVLGILITASGIAGLSLYLLRSRVRSPLLLWFGAFALLYGVRVLVKTPTTELLFEQSSRFWRFAEITISNFILIPAVLFAEQLYGRGWRSSMRWLLWFAVTYAIFAMIVDFASGNPNAVPDAGIVVLIPLAILFVIGYSAGYRPPPITHARALVFGIAVFLLTVVNEHLINNGLLPWKVRLETLGFFVQICAMGYVAIRQVFDNERNLRALEDEMRSATRIQSSILPRTVPQLDGARICVRYLPMTSVAGDFYEFLALDSHRVGIAIADVAGHGVPAALVASMVKVAIDSQSALAADPAGLMGGLNTIMCRQARGNLITAGYLFLDLDQRRACYSAAAHPPLLVRRRATGVLLDFRENGLIIGVRPGETYPPTSFELFPGDRILLYTDGIAEAASANDELFSERRLAEVLASHDGASGNSFAQLLIDEVRAWSRIDQLGQADDMTLIVVDIE